MFCGAFPIRSYTLGPREDAENAFDLLPEGEATDKITVFCRSDQDFSKFVKEFALLKR